MNGNMVSDANKGIIDIAYNHLNLPTTVQIGNGPGAEHNGTISYVYDATGTKLAKQVANDGANTTTVTEYAGGFIYENGQLKMFSTPEGYVEPNGNGGFNYVYNYLDHLGNVRLTYADSDGNGSIDASTEIISEKNYYPFGLLHRGYNNVVSANANSQASKYGFGGKELSDELGLDWHDFDARNYDAALGRWMNLDPLAESYYEWSPYNYSYNSPIIFTDPTGLGPIYDADGNLVGYEVEEGQGPSQIAEDLNTIGLQAEVDYLDIVYSNPEKFEHIDDVTDINHEGFTELDINEGDVISIDKVLEREADIAKKSELSEGSDNPNGENPYSVVENSKEINDSTGNESVLPKGDTGLISYDTEKGIGTVEAIQEGLGISGSGFAPFNCPMCPPANAGPPSGGVGYNSYRMGISIMHKKDHIPILKKQDSIRKANGRREDD